VRNQGMISPGCVVSLYKPVKLPEQWQRQPQGNNIQLLSKRLWCVGCTWGIIREAIELQTPYNKV